MFRQKDQIEENNLRVVALPQVVGEVVLDVLGELLEEVGVEEQHLCQTRDVEHLKIQHLDQHESIELEAFRNRLQLTISGGVRKMPFCSYFQFFCSHLLFVFKF